MSKFYTNSLSNGDRALSHPAGRRWLDCLEHKWLRESPWQPHLLSQPALPARTGQLPKLEGLGVRGGEQERRGVSAAVPSTGSITPEAVCVCMGAVLPGCGGGSRRS